MFKLTDDHIVEKTLKIELSPIPEAYPLKLNDTNVTVAFFSKKKGSSKYVVKNARNVTQCVRQPFSIEFQGFVKKKRISNVNNLCHQEAWN
jgi:hypothetical protein